jgi:hypothetical protein
MKKQLTFFAPRQPVGRCNRRTGAPLRGINSAELDEVKINKFVYSTQYFDNLNNEI